jgi:hypothetical protein
MKIKLNDKYQITGIPMNFALEEKKVYDKGDKAGQEYWVNSGYYPDLESLLSGLLRRHVLASECEDVILLIQEIKIATQTIMEQIKLLERGGEHIEKYPVEKVSST